MLGRSIFQLGVCCLVLCACKGNYPKKTSCAADGGCAGMSADAAMSGGEAGSAGHAGSAARSSTQAAKVAKDAGASSDMKDAGAVSKKDEGAGGSSAASSSMKASKSSAGAGGSAMKAAKKEEAGKGGSNEEAGAGGADPGDQSDGDDTSKADCEPTCGPCQACGDDNKTCNPVTGRDDADSCNGARSCSSRGECLHISEAQPELGDNQDAAELDQGYAQVLTFTDPATIQEIRLEVSCKENDQTFPAAWLAAAPGGIPSDTILATANVIAQAPTESNAFALLELSKTLEEPAAGPIAIVVSQTDMSCSIRLNKQTPYPNGALFTQTGTLWAPADGSMVFQVLSSQ